MTNEIERKFLVKGDYRPYISRSIHITQGYLSSNPERTVRIRLKEDAGFITVKGKSSLSGATRFEWEKPISKEEAQSLMALCEPGIIDKIRHLVPESGGLTFEVDEFFGENQGLIMAEIELPMEDYSFTKPNWLGEEVTGDVRFYNSMLMKNPFKKWK